MTQTAPLTPDQIAALAARLDSFRAALSPPEQGLLDDILRRAARAAAEEATVAAGAEAAADAEAADVQGYYSVEATLATGAQSPEQRPNSLNALQAPNPRIASLRDLMTTVQGQMFGGGSSAVGGAKRAF